MNEYECVYDRILSEINTCESINAEVAVVKLADLKTIANVFAGHKDFPRLVKGRKPSDVLVGSIVGTCPLCDRFVQSGRDHSTNYCHHCGQALVWEDKE